MTLHRFLMSHQHCSYLSNDRNFLHCWHGNVLKPRQRAVVLSLHHDQSFYATFLQRLHAGSYNLKKTLLWSFHTAPQQAPTVCRAQLEEIHRLKFVHWAKFHLKLQHLRTTHAENVLLLYRLKQSMHCRNMVVSDNKLSLVTAAEKRVSKFFKDSFSFLLVLSSLRNFHKPW